MKFTGERFVPTEQGQIRIEHYHRYAVVKDIVDGKDVLDLACGEGYGSYFLSGHAKSVIGIDISAESIAHANSEYRSLNLNYLQGDATNLSLQNQSFDVVVSFETIEHLAEQNEMLAEIKRVLRPNGILIISSPNRPVYSEENAFHNEFHVKELDFNEFDELLRKQFNSVNYYGQRLLIGSIIQQFKREQKDLKIWHDDGMQLESGIADLDKPVYFLAVCGNDENKLFHLNASFVYPTNLDLINQYIGYAKWAKSVDNERVAQDKLISKLQDELNESNQWAKALDRELSESRQLADKLIFSLKERGDWAHGLEKELAECRALITQLQTELAERGEWAQSLDKTLAERSELIQHLQAELMEKTVWAQTLQDELANSSALTITLQTELAERGEWAQSLDKTLAERSELIQHLQAELAEKIDWVETLRDELVANSTLLENLQADIIRRDDLVKKLQEKQEMLEQQNVALDDQNIEQTQTIQNLEKETQQYLQKIEELNQLIVEQNAEIMALTDEVVRRGDWGLSLDKEIEVLRNNLDQIRTSNSWIVTWPLRESRRWITSPINQIKHYTRLGLRLSKRIYQSLPLSYKTKNYHRQLIANNCPNLLLLSGSHESTLPAKMIPVINEGHNDELIDLLSFAERINITSSTEPLVSVIIPIYGQIQYTLRCLESIMNNTPNVEFEVIIVDDCSPDNSFEILKNIRGIKLKQNRINKGFIQTCNYGAKIAKGQYLYFLNNDTQVLPEWMDALVRTFKDFPGTGLAGSKLVYPDGRLQEAGGIIWQDGSAWNFGRLQDPLLPVYNYAREVDYCSGASIMVPQEIFNKLGGFDKHYLPAYCEDSDLALKIRKAGYRVIYQPMSTIIHYEGITSGKDTSTGAKSYQVDNSKKLFSRWKDFLKTYQPNGVDVDSAKDRRATRRVLILEHCTLTPNQDAGSVTVYNLIMLLREMDFQVTFIPEDNFLYMPDYTTDLQRVGVEVLYYPYVKSVQEHVAEYGDRYELVFLFRPVVVERHIDTVKKYCNKAKFLYYTHDLHFIRMTREAQLLGDSSKQHSASEMKVREYAAIQACDATIVVTEQELEVLMPDLPDCNIQVLPLVLSIAGTNKKYQNRRDVVFVGGYQHGPNVDAVHYFVSEIMPILRQRLKDVKFVIVGSNPPEEIRALAAEDIVIKGFVEDLNSLLDEMRVSVAPLRYGAGIKGKVGTAMAVGLPVVASNIATEGMSLTDGENVLCANSPEEFANQIARIYLDDILWNKISKNALDFSENAWGAKSGYRNFSSVLASIDINTSKPKYPLKMYASC